jgi:adenylosuccinate synthase
MPHHKFIDSLMEGELKKNLIGSTGKGIGPAYSSKHSRRGMRMGDFLLPKEELHEIVIRATGWGNKYVELFGAPPLSEKKVASDFVNIQELVRPMIADTQELVMRWKGEKKSIMLEGAQGTLLDIDHGTYPYVTSSNCSIGGAITGSGLAPRDIGRVIGIFKAYTTRVGNGPFPTELEDETGECLREKGGEFGTTTGRPRRCGWFDLVAARYAVGLNGLDEITLTKLDVLSGHETLRICVAYELDGERIDYFPQNVLLLSRCKPIYEDVPGWGDRELGGLGFDDLPAEAMTYINTLEERLGVRISFVSTGPERSSTIVREQL